MTWGRSQPEPRSRRGLAIVWLRHAQTRSRRGPHTITCTEPPSLCAWKPASEALETDEPLRRRVRRRYGRVRAARAASAPLASPSDRRLDRGHHHCPGDRTSLVAYAAYLNTLHSIETFRPVSAAADPRLRRVGEHPARRVGQPGRKQREIWRQVRPGPALGHHADRAHQTASPGRGGGEPAPRQRGPDPGLQGRHQARLPGPAGRSGPDRDAATPPSPSAARCACGRRSSRRPESGSTTMSGSPSPDSSTSSTTSAG